MRFRIQAVACCVVLAALLDSFTVSGQDDRSQYPRFLANSYVGLNVGYIDYAFSESHLESGFNAQSVRVPHLAAGVFLFGHEFNKYLAAQLTYLRPVEWVRYENINSDRSSHSVWMNIAGLTVKSRLPLTDRVSIYGEGGLGLVTRKGFDLNGVIALKDAEYAAPLLGSGIDYDLNSNWRLSTGVTFSPQHHSDTQPATFFVSTGFRYIMRPADKHADTSAEPSTPFPRNTVQVGYITNALGYGVNDFFSKGAVPIFWSADVQTANGVSANYQRNVFHTRRVFSLHWGAGITALKSNKEGQSFVAASVYPLLRFTLIRTKPADVYVDYSFAGPAIISRTNIDHEDTGRHFTFQDFMGAGLFMDHRRRLNVEVRIAHYSNGNLFPHNPGVTVPLGFNVGYTF